MYWCNRFLFFIAAIMAVQSISSCKSDSHADSYTKQFFDLKKYFASESIRLAKTKPLITKTAVNNSIKETKKVSMPNWNDELSLFSESDINKPAWKASYKVSTSEGITTYTAIDPDVKTRYIILKKQQDKVKLILIYNYTKTTLFGKALYWTTEHLSYIPDSIYTIQKEQYIRTLGRNKYFIKGLFN
jgi:hypothetical protein